MKTLSIKNPWGYLIADGFKDVENRSWPTKYRGVILIHTSQKSDSSELSSSFILLHSQLLTSAIIGSVEIVDCIQDSKSIWAERGQWHWVLKNPKLFKNPILNVKGRLSLWDYPIGLID